MKLFSATRKLASTLGTAVGTTLGIARRHAAVLTSTAAVVGAMALAAPAANAQRVVIGVGVGGYPHHAYGAHDGYAYGPRYVAPPVYGYGYYGPRPYVAPYGYYQHPYYRHGYWR